MQRIHFCLTLLWASRAHCNKITVFGKSESGCVFTVSSSSVGKMCLTASELFWSVVLSLGNYSLSLNRDFFKHISRFGFFHPVHAGIWSTQPVGRLKVVWKRSPVTTEEFNRVETCSLCKLTVNDNMHCKYNAILSCGMHWMPCPSMYVYKSSMSRTACSWNCL